MKLKLRLLSMLLVLALLLTCFPIAAASAETHFDAVTGATGGGGDDDDDDDHPASFGNSVADVTQYELAPFDPGSCTGTSLSALMDESPIFYCGSASPIQLMYYCIRGYAYMFYLYGNSYSDYVGISYGYEDAIDVRDENVWQNLKIGTPRQGDETVYRGEASVDDSEGSFLSLDVFASAGSISDLSPDEAGCVGSWENLVNTRKSEYIGKPLNDASAFDGVTCATKYSAAIREAVLDALGLSAAEPEPTADPTPGPEDGALPAHTKYITGDGAQEEYVLHLSVTAKDGTETVVIPGEPASDGANIVLVVDVSGSISDAMLVELNASIRRLVSDLPDGSQLGLVEFADTATEGEVFSSAAQVPEISETDGSSNLAPALVNARALLANSVAWDRPDNAKVIVVISDGEFTDPDDAIAEANSSAAGSSRVHNYCISVRTDTPYIPGEVYWINGGYGSGEDYSMAMLQAVSDNYLNAYTEDTSFIYRTVVLGERNADGRDYVFGTNGTDWSAIFTSITENEIVEQHPVPMSEVVIRDVLSEYVELAYPDTEGFGVTVDNAPLFTAELNGSELTVSLAEELTEGATYTVNIPITPSRAAVLAANAAEGTSVMLPTNDGADLSFNWGDERVTCEYEQTPQILVEKQSFTLTVHYVFASGEQAFDDHVETVYFGDRYFVESPMLDGYTPDAASVEGTMGDSDLTFTVTYEQDAPSYLRGDVNQDGVVDATDALLTMRYAMGLIELTPEQLLIADLNGDGDATVTDAVIIMRIAMGMA